MSENLNLPAPEPIPSDEQIRWINDEVRPCEPALRGYLRTQFPSIDADDVVQEAYLKLLKGKAACKIASAKAYFFTVARNTALTIFRRKQIYSPVRVSELPGWRVLDGEPDAAEAANAKDRFGLAVEAIDQLPPRCRIICSMAVLQQLSPASIALQLGIAESTVHVQMARGLTKCAKYLRDRGERP